jgi:hypothetical protein
MKRLYRILVGKAEEMRPHEISRPKWKDNIKMDFRKWDGGMDCIDLP